MFGFWTQLERLGANLLTHRRNVNVIAPLRAKNEVPWIMGIGCSHHNSSVCILHGSELVVAIQEERLSGAKRHGFCASDITLSVPYCLNAAGIKASDLDLAVFCTAGYPADHPRNDITLNSQLRVNANGIAWINIPHHLAHAISGYALSGLSESLILVIDGLGSPFNDLTEGEKQRVVGQNRIGSEHVSVYEAKGTTLKCLEKHLSVGNRWLIEQPGGMPFFRSLGAMYSAVAQQVFGSPLEAGKVMGLAPYGEPKYTPEEFYSIEQGVFSFCDRIPSMYPYDIRWPANQREYANLAASVQNALEHAVLQLCRRTRDMSDIGPLCYTGGVALNCKINHLIHESGLFSELFIQPAAEDSGPAIGAAYYGLWNLKPVHTAYRLTRDSLGHTYENSEILHQVKRLSSFFKINNVRPEQLYQEVATRIAAGEVCGYFQGGSELGPRALGYRSIFADPRKVSLRDRINGEIKGREFFRPLAPVILQDRVHEWFECGKYTNSPFMLRNLVVRSDKRALIPAVTHIDGTGRVQTVPSVEESSLFQLISAFSSLTDVPVLLNTSFNGPSEPIVETPLDAIWGFVSLGLDCLLLGDQLIIKDDRNLSILDLIPFIVSNECICSIEIRDGQLREEIAPEKGLRFWISTPWGIREHYFFAREAKVIAMIDGVMNGWQLEKLLEGEIERPEQLGRTLAALRRLGVVSFRDP